MPINLHNFKYIMQKLKNIVEINGDFLLKMKLKGGSIAKKRGKPFPFERGLCVMIWNENGENNYCDITPALMNLREQWEKKNYIDPKLYKEYNVKRGLRDENGRGVLTGLTRVAEIQSYQVGDARTTRSSPTTACSITGASTAGSW
jgi:hypothetical protein